MMPDNAIHEALDALNDVCWRKTAFADLQWYYAEGGVYIIRCKHGKPDASLCAIRARSADEAVARAVFDLHMAGYGKSAQVGYMAAMREALVKIYHEIRSYCNDYGAGESHKSLVDRTVDDPPDYTCYRDSILEIDRIVEAALSAPPHTGKWKNGRKYEYEYAYCSACGHMQWASWDTHKQAEEMIGTFHEEYKFCPNCGAKMEGGVYVK